MANGNPTGYMDPCDEIEERGDEGTGGSSPPPLSAAPPPEVDTTAVFPWNERGLRPESDNFYYNYSRKMYMIDSSNFYYGLNFRTFDLGLRTPGELDMTIPTPSNVRQSSLSMAGIRRLKVETDLLRSEDNILDIPPRDIFRHLMGKVWTQTGPLGNLSVKNRIQPRTIENPDAPGGKSFLFDYSKMGYTNDEREPYMFYVWSEEEVTPVAGILNHCVSEMGLRFHLPTLKEKIMSSPRSRNFWNSDTLLSRDGEFIPSRLTQILDSWFYGSRAQSISASLVNPRRNWLIDENAVYEDSTFTAPASFDTDLNLNDSEFIESHATQVGIVTLDSRSSLSDETFRVDRENLRVSLNEGVLQPEELTSQPYQTPPRDRLNFYSRTSNLDQRVGEGIINNNSLVQKFTGQDVVRMKNLRIHLEQDNQEIKELLNQHVSITFEQHTSNIAKILQDNKLSGLVLDVFHQSQNFNETFTQILDNDNYDLISNSVNIDTRSAIIDQDDPRLVGAAIALNADVIRDLTTPKKVRDFFYKLIQQNELLSTDQDFKDNIRSHYPYGNIIAGSAIYDGAGNPSWFETARLELVEELRNRERSYADLLLGKKAHSQVIAYKIVKKDVKTGEVVQVFYLFNEQNLEQRQITFIDTQVAAQERYEYSIFTINAVVASEYKYIDPGAIDFDGERFDYDFKYEKDGPRGKHQADDPKDLSLDYYRATVRVTNHLHLIEAPYYQRAVSLGDFPPVRPDVTFLPELGVDDKFTLLFQQNIRAPQSQKPIPIIQEDLEIIQRMNSEQEPNLMGEITYLSIAPPLIYEVMVLEEPPSSYEDFSSSVISRTDFRNPFIQFRIDPNKDYYMIARSADRPGISNPTEVFKIRMESHEDGINPIFERYDMTTSRAPAKIRFQNIISIQPSQVQKMIDFSQVVTDQEEYRRGVLEESFFDEAPSVRDVQLGDSSSNTEKIWNKRYKFRFKSKTTSKCIDINVDFKERKLEVERSSQNTQETNEGASFVTQAQIYEDLRGQAQYRYDEDAYEENQFEDAPDEIPVFDPFDFLDEESAFLNQIEEEDLIDFGMTQDALETAQEIFEDSGLAEIMEEEVEDTVLAGPGFFDAEENLQINEDGSVSSPYGEDPKTFREQIEEQEQTLEEKMREQASQLQETAQATSEFMLSDESEKEKEQEKEKADLADINDKAKIVEETSTTLNNMGMGATGGKTSDSPPSSGGNTGTLIGNDLPPAKDLNVRVSTTKPQKTHAQVMAEKNAEAKKQEREAGLVALKDTQAKVVATKSSTSANVKDDLKSGTNNTSEKEKTSLEKTTAVAQAANQTLKNTAGTGNSGINNQFLGNTTIGGSTLNTSAGTFKYGY